MKSWTSVHFILSVPKQLHREVLDRFNFSMLRMWKRWTSKYVQRLFSITFRASWLLPFKPISKLLQRHDIGELCIVVHPWFCHGRIKRSRSMQNWKIRMSKRIQIKKEHRLGSELFNALFVLTFTPYFYSLLHKAALFFVLPYKTEKICKEFLFGP